MRMRMRTSNSEHSTSNSEVKRGGTFANLLLMMGILAVGCQGNSRNLEQVPFERTPAAVQVGFLAYFTPAATIKKVERERLGDQDYYTFTFLDKDHNDRVVELNEGGDQVQER